MNERMRADSNGIPEFWTTVLLKCDVTAELVKDKDLEVLNYLRDITVSERKPQSFREGWVRMGRVAIRHNWGFKGARLPACRHGEGGKA